MSNFVLCPGVDCPLKTVCLRANTVPTSDYNIFTTPPHEDGHCEFYLTKNGEDTNTDDED